MIAVVFLGAAMLTLMLGMTASLNAVESIHNYNVAAELLSIKLAEVEQKVTLEEGAEEGEFDEAHPGFTWQTEIIASDLKDLYEIRLTVQWSERGQEVSDSITTYLYRASQQPQKLGEVTKKPGEASQR